MVNGLIVASSLVNDINLTILLSVISVCLAAMGTIIRIYTKPKNKEEMPGSNPHCVHMEEKIDRLEQTQKKDIEKLNNDNKEKENNTKQLKSIVLQLEKEIAILEKESQSQSKTLDEIKSSNRELAKRLDELLKQLMDFAS